MTLEEARALELSEKLVSQTEHKSADSETNAMFKKKEKARNFKHPVPQEKRRTVKCRNCGLDYPHKNSKCPAEGKTCNLKICKKKKHFASVLC